MSRLRIPLIILGGRDRRGTELPAGGRDQHPLSGYKGAELSLAGRPLIAVLIERMAETGVFDPIYIAGPRSVYGDELAGARVIDTDGSFGDNLRTAVEAICADGVPAQLAATTSDILPDREELARAVADLVAHQPLDFWMPQSRIPDDLHRLGESAWKPKYHLQPPAADAPVPILPGHIIVCNPGVARLSLIYRMFELLYRTRNRPLAERRRVLTRHLLWLLFLGDLRHLLSLRRPRLMWDVVYHSLRVASRLKSGRATTREIEDGLRRVFIQYDHRRRHPQRRGRAPVLDALSLARDIDTVEEAREIMRKG